jgi:hypothetical protein
MNVSHPPIHNLQLSNPWTARTSGRGVARPTMRGTDGRLFQMMRGSIPKKPDYFGRRAE